MLPFAGLAQELGGKSCGHAKTVRNLHQNRSNTLSLHYIDLTEAYDVTFYFLDIELERTSTDIAGTVEIHATAREAIDTFMFELYEDLVITDIRRNGTVSVPFTRDGSAVIVEDNYTMGQSFYYAIDYNGSPPTAATNPLGGGGMTNDSSPSWGNQVTWSLSEPFSAYEWWPCKQSLTDKADSVWVFITTDNTNKAGSQGILTNVTDMGGGKDRYEWKSKYPIVYYLVSVSVATYVEYTIYANPTGASGPIPVVNYVYDNPSTLPYFQSEIDLTADFIEYFSELYGLYPFELEKYGHCMAPLSGGMEHQTMTTQGWFESGLTAHELGHQWFGDNVTCASWSDIWLNEGFASYSEELMMEQFYPWQVAGSMQDRHDNIMSQPGGSVWVEDSLDEGSIFSGRLSYDKGAAIIHTMRYLIDDDVTFFNVLKQYQIDFTDSSATASDFKNILENITGDDYTNYFNEWYYGEGFPHYKVTYNVDGDSLRLIVEQTTSMPSSVPFFTNDLDIEVLSTLSIPTSFRLTDIDGPVKQYAFEYNAEVGAINVDKDNWIINTDEIEEDPGLVGIYANEINYSVYPNPVSDALYVEWTGNESTFQLISIGGKVILTGTVYPGMNSLDLSDYPCGTYLLKSNGLIETIVVE